MSRPMILSPSRRSARSRGGLISAVLRWAGLRRQRVALARLDDHLLADIGLTRHVAAAEAERPFWDAPEGWIR